MAKLGATVLIWKLTDVAVVAPDGPVQVAPAAAAGTEQLYVNGVLKPFCAVRLIVAVTLLPCATLYVATAGASVKLGWMTVSVAAADIGEGAFEPSPSYMALTLSVPAGRDVVENVTTPLPVLVRAAMPRAVVEPLLKKLTFPRAAVEESVALNVTF
jgi:hypothetical protein